MFRRRAFNGAGLAPDLPATTMAALTQTEPEGPHGAQRSLDTLISSGARVIAQVGLVGGDGFLVPDGDTPDAATPRIYPDTTTPRIVARMQVTLSPGSFLGLEVLSLPAGPMQADAGPSLLAEDGRGGSVKMSVTYVNADFDIRVAECEITFAGSVEAYGGEPPSAHDALVTSRAVALPFGNEPDAAEAAKFARGNDVAALLEISYLGSPRVIDLAVVETAVELVVELVEPKWPSNMYSDGGAPYDELPSEFPVSQLGTTDPGGGTAAIRRALLEHGRQVGPCLCFWSSAGEHSSVLADWISYDGGTGDDEAPAITGSSTSLRQIPYGIPPFAILPGMQLGHYARQVDHGDEYLDGRTGVLPVWLVVYAKATDAIFQFRAGDDEWSAVELTATGDSWQWFLMVGWIEVGTGPEDAPRGQLLARSPSGSAWAVRDWGVFMRVTD